MTAGSKAFAAIVVLVTVAMLAGHSRGVHRIIHAHEVHGARAAQATSCPSGADALRAAMLDVHERQRNVGLSAAILRDGEIVFTGTLGEAELAFDVPVTAETRFGIASISKAFTGTAISILVERGELDPDADVRRYVQAFPELGRKRQVSTGGGREKPRRCEGESKLPE